MIKINLLPTKKRPPRKVTELQQQLILGTFILFILAFGMFSYWKSLSNKIERLQREKAAAQARIDEQTKMLNEVKSVEAERKKVNEKIAIIEQLKKNQGTLVHLFDELSTALPKGVNIVSLADKSGQGSETVSLDGTAFTNNDIVRFVDNLKAAPHFSDVNLSETAQATQEGFDIYKYKLQFTFKGE
jgi:type IV pilus assembly protein PilN